MERYLLIVGRVFVAAMILFLAVMSWSLYRTLTEYAPLEPYATQQVLNAPIRLGEPVVVEGVKCNGSPLPVLVSGVLLWQPIDPPGTGIEVGRGTRTFDPGCTELTFENQWPAEALELTERWLAEGRRVVWHIIGEDTPIAPDGTRGRPVSFETENFEIVR